MGCNLRSMKIIVILAILGFAIVLFRGRIAYFFANQWDKMNAVKEEEEMLSLLVEKYEKSEIKVLMSCGNVKFRITKRKPFRWFCKKERLSIRFIGKKTGHRPVFFPIYRIG